VSKVLHQAVATRTIRSSGHNSRWISRSRCCSRCGCRRNTTFAADINVTTIGLALVEEATFRSSNNGFTTLLASSNPLILGQAEFNHYVAFVALHKRRYSTARFDRSRTFWAKVNEAVLIHACVELIGPF